MTVENMESLYKEAFKKKTTNSIMDKLISNAKGEDKQRLKEFKWFTSCCDVDKADFEALIRLNKSYQIWQEIFIEILYSISNGENSDNNEKKASKTLSGDEIEFIFNDRINRKIEDYDNDYEEDYDEDEDEEDEEEEEE